ncbi:uncharacterized protein MONOS_17647 [Monocercomonoides exilis]|uniref:uncharacterized protein n=1 Tax=Monocercomonoides exilis TaxID=2049356 RepID=UPI003559EE77|nr:hypothetical protein MONOS_17647 [Monocercomonoides exilis]
MMSTDEKFKKFLFELEDCDEDEQKRKIEEMNASVEAINNEEFKSFFTEELFKKVNKMIEKRKISIENALLLLKHIEYCKPNNRDVRENFHFSLRATFEKLIAEEEVKKEKRNEKLLIDLCTCYLMNNNYSVPNKLLEICLPCIFRVALNNEENKETQKEVEMALSALSGIWKYNKVKPELYLKEITEIILYHQNHHNLTRLAYQSAWNFLIKRFFNNESLEDLVVNEFHFVREAIGEMEELFKCVNWEGKEEKRGKERKEMPIISSWIATVRNFLWVFKKRKEEFVGLINIVVRIFRVAKDNYEDISFECTETFRLSLMTIYLEVDDFLKGGAFDASMKKATKLELINLSTKNCLYNLEKLYSRLRLKYRDERAEAKRKETVRKIFDKLEEEGYEDDIVALNPCMIKQRNKGLRCHSFSFICRENKSRSFSLCNFIRRLNFFFFFFFSYFILNLHFNFLSF